MAELLNFEISGFLLVFARVGAMFILLPGFSDQSVSPRVRLMLAILVSLVVFPVAARHLPTALPNEVALIGYLVGEIAIGLMLGAIIRMFFAALVVAGTAIGLQSGLAAATLFNPGEGQQSAMIGRFLGLAAVVLMFAAGLHHLIVASMVRSYMIFGPGSAIASGDFATLAIETVATSFALGIQLAAPFLVYGLVFNVGLGLMARLAPTLQVFFIAQPLNIMLAFALMMMMIGLVLTEFTRRFGGMLSELAGVNG